MFCDTHHMPNVEMWRTQVRAKASEDTIALGEKQRRNLAEGSMKLAQSWGNGTSS
jgi:hypothetical protein